MLDDNENDTTSSIKDKVRMKKMIMLIKIVSIFKNEKDEMKKNKIKYAMKALDDSNSEVKNEMIDFTFQVYATEIESFDSMDSPLNILDFTENDCEE